MNADRIGRWRFFGRIAGAVVLLAMAVPGIALGAAPASPTLTMEELEVRGKLEKPDRLFVPVSWPTVPPSPLRLDLFREDLLKPIFPWEIPNGTQSSGFPRE